MGEALMSHPGAWTFLSSCISSTSDPLLVASFSLDHKRGCLSFRHVAIGVIVKGASSEMLNYILEINTMKEDNNKRLLHSGAVESTHPCTSQVSQTFY